MDEVDDEEEEQGDVFDITEKGRRKGERRRRKQ